MTKTIIAICNYLQIIYVFIAIGVAGSIEIEEITLQDGVYRITLLLLAYLVTFTVQRITENIDMM